MTWKKPVQKDTIGEIIALSEKSIPVFSIASAMPAIMDALAIKWPIFAALPVLLAATRLHSRYSSPAYRQQRNLRFTSPVTEISELMVWNMFGNNGNEIGNRFSPYVFGGVGVSFLKVDRSSNLNKSYFVNEPNVTSGLAADMNKIPPRAILVLPAGIGVEYFLTSNLSLTAETNFRYTFTDYLDGFSQVANPKKKDFYQSHTVGLVFKFNKNKGLPCPVIKR